MKIIDLLQRRGGAFPANRREEDRKAGRLLSCHRAPVARTKIY